MAAPPSGLASTVGPGRRSRAAGRGRQRRPGWLRPGRRDPRGRLLAGLGHRRGEAQASRTLAGSGWPVARARSQPCSTSSSRTTPPVVSAGRMTPPASASPCQALDARHAATRASGRSYSRPFQSAGRSPSRSGAPAGKGSLSTAAVKAAASPRRVSQGPSGRRSPRRRCGPAVPSPGRGRRRSSYPSCR